MKYIAVLFALILMSCVYYVKEVPAPESLQYELGYQAAYKAIELDFDKLETLIDIQQNAIDSLDSLYKKQLLLIK
jgi:hypothetical protein